jgi:hypothetical protein
LSSDWRRWTDQRIAGLLADHVRYYEETLSHIFMGDVTRFAGALAGHEGSDSCLLDSILWMIERALRSGAPEVQELVVVSFLENLQYSDDFYAQIARRLGPESKRVLEIVERER